MAHTITGVVAVAPAAAFRVASLVDSDEERTLHHRSASGTIGGGGVENLGDARPKPVATAV